MERMNRPTTSSFSVPWIHHPVQFIPNHSRLLVDPISYQDHSHNPSQPLHHSSLSLLLLLSSLSLLLLLSSLSLLLLLSSLSLYRSLFLLLSSLSPYRSLSRQVCTIITTNKTITEITTSWIRTGSHLLLHSIPSTRMIRHS